MVSAAERVKQLEEFMAIGVLSEHIDKKRLKVVAKESLDRNIADDEFPGWALDVINGLQDLTWVKDENTAKRLKVGRQATRAAGAQVAVEQLAGAKPLHGGVPKELLGNSGQGASSSMHIIRSAVSLAGGAPPPPMPYTTNAATPAVLAAPPAPAPALQPPAAAAAAALAPPSFVAPSVQPPMAEPSPPAAPASHSRDLTKYVKKLRKALAEEPETSVVGTTVSVLESITAGLREEHRAAVLQHLAGCVAAAPPLDPFRRRLAGLEEAEVEPEGEGFGAGPSELPPSEPRSEQPPAPETHATYLIFAKLSTGRNIALHVHNEMQISEVKELVATKGGFGEGAHLRLIFAGRELHNDQLLEVYNIGKEATIHQMMAGRGRPMAAGTGTGTTPPPQAAEESAEESDEEIEEKLSLIQRPTPFGGSYPDFDRSDGWATAQGVDIKPIQQWVLERDRELAGKWIQYGQTGNSLQYLLDRDSHAYHGAMALHLKQWFGPTNPKEGAGFEGFEEPSNWESAPSCVLAAVQQLRDVLVCPGTGERLLDEFHLGFAQFTRSAPSPLKGVLPRALSRPAMQCSHGSPSPLAADWRLRWADVLWLSLRGVRQCQSASPIGDCIPRVSHPRVCRLAASLGRIGTAPATVCLAGSNS